MNKSCAMVYRTAPWLIPLFIFFLLLTTQFTALATQETNNPIQLTPEERNWLNSHPVIRLAPDPAFMPIEYFDENGNYRGAAADIVRLLERKLGITITIVRLKGWDEVMAKFKAQEVDLLGAIVRTPAREQFALFTEPLVTVPGGIFTRRDNAGRSMTIKDLSGKKVAVVSNYTAHDVLQSQYPEIILDVVPDVPTGLAKASLGMVDAYVENMANATYYSQKAGITNLRLAGTTSFDYRWSIGVRKDWPLGLGILNKGLAAITPEERKTAINRWIHVEQQQWRPGKNFIIATLAAAFSVILAGGAIWNSSLRRQVRNRTESLQRGLEERQRAESALQTLTDELEERVRNRTSDLEWEIAERTKAEHALRFSEERYRLFTTLTSDYVYQCVRHVPAPYHVKWMGGAVESITGYNEDEIFDKGCWLPLVHPEDRGRIQERLAQLKPGDTDTAEFRLITKSGNVRWIQEVCRCESGEADQEFILFGSSRDITERRLAEESLRRSEEEQHRLEQQMMHTQKLESMGILAGGIAHDFNNILMSIIGNADLALLRLNPESPAVDNLHRIEQAAARAADLAKQMLAYSGKGKFVIESIDLNRLVEEMTHMLEVSISKKAILRYNFTRSIPSVEADSTQIRQIIMNLVINASEAIGDRSGVIAITTGCMDCDRSYLKNVWLDEELSEGLYVFLEVADTGCGMEKETIAKIFDPFFTTKFAGRGLGMAAVLGIVRGHKGAIKVYSEPGRGTTFKILFPAGERPSELFDFSEKKSDWMGCGLVLLVDDEETVCAIGGEMLRELGFQVITASNGLEALERFNERKDIDLVMLDLTMPHLDGEHTFRELRRIQPEVRVIMCSGYNEQEVAQKFVGKGLAGFIQKPYKLSDLRDLLSRVCRQ